MAKDATLSRRVVMTTRSCDTSFRSPLKQLPPTTFLTTAARYNSAAALEHALPIHQPPIELAPPPTGHTRQPLLLHAPRASGSTTSPLLASTPQTLHYLHATTPQVHP
jgi:hypothetical protein